jgi:anaerobic magnesium-protoporphyrin IX monomethyl ester cyclase
MRIWLVVPPRPAGQVLNLLPPYSLGYLAAAMLRAGHEPRIIDCPLEGMDVDALVRAVISARPDAVGFTMFTSDYTAVAAACQAIKHPIQAPLTILGGIHPSSFPLPTLEALPQVDYIFCGEAETSLIGLLDILQENPRRPDHGALALIRGLGWRTDGQARVTPNVPITELDALGMPAWELINPLRYQNYPPTLFVRQRPFAPIITTRGCPYRCTYCAGHNVGGYRLRNRSLDLVFREINLLVQRFGIRELHIEDDNFTWNRERVMEFCEELLRRNLGLTWTMPNGVRLDTLDLEMLRLMKRAGCYLLILGVESGSDRILSHMHKKITVAQVREKAALVRQAGILPHAFFMLGYPEETAEDIQATYHLALSLPLIGAHFSSYRPLPGTESAEALLKRGEIKAFDFTAEHGTFASVVYAPPGMTVPQIKAWQRRMLVRFYFRPRILARYLWEMVRHPGLAVNLLRRAWVYLFGKNK